VQFDKQLLKGSRIITRSDPRCYLRELQVCALFNTKDTKGLFDVPTEHLIMYYDTLAETILNLLVSGKLTDMQVMGLNGESSKLLMNQVAMLLDETSYADAFPFQQSEIDAMLLEVSDKLLIDPAVAK
jgi:hypothetical protein